MRPAHSALIAAQVDTSSTDLSWWEAVILGLVEGITEYLPVSSTGHLLFAAELLGLADNEVSEQAVETFAICIQIGAIAAVLLLYQERLRSMLDGLLGRSEEGRTVLGAVLAAFIPTALIGLVARPVMSKIFAPWPIAIAWLVGGLGILYLVRVGWFQRGRDELHQLTLKHAAIIGVAQALAIWPGVSRSLITIVAAVGVGLSLRAAVEFSFLLGLITLSAATVLEGLDNGPTMIETFGWFTPAIGLVVGFVSALAAVRWMVGWLESRGFAVFGWYRIGIGILAMVLLVTGVV